MNKQEEQKKPTYLQQNLIAARVIFEEARDVANVAVDDQPAVLVGVVRRHLLQSVEAVGCLPVSCHLFFLPILFFFG